MAKKRKKRLAKKQPTRRPTLAKQPYDISEGVTQSLLSTWCNCRVAAAYYLQGWRSLTFNEPMEHGSFMHGLLEQMYRGVRAGTVTRENAPDLFAPFAEEWMKKIGTWATGAELQKAELVIAKAAAVFEPYCQYHAADFEPSEWIEVEGKFDVQFDEFRLRGMCDGGRRVSPRYKRKTNPWDLWIMETKNKAQKKSTEEDKLRIDFQNQFYLAAWGEQLDPSLQAKLKGVHYNIIKRPSHRLKQTETLPEYTQRVRAAVEKEPDEWFRRSEVVYPPQQRAAFRERLLTKLHLFRSWVENDFEPMYDNDRSCDSGGTCCMFKACTSYGKKKGYRLDGRLFEELED